MGQWLKAIGGYTVEQIGEHFVREHEANLSANLSVPSLLRFITDNYPSGVSAFGIFSTLSAAIITDSLPGQPRWPVLVYMAFCCIVGAICILVWSSPTGLKFFGYCE